MTSPSEGGWTAEPRVFVHRAGSIFWRNVYMDDAQVQSQLDLLLKEHDCCLRKGMVMDARHARGLFLDLTDALKAQQDWKRAGTSQRKGVG